MAVDSRFPGYCPNHSGKVFYGGRTYTARNV